MRSVFTRLMIFASAPLFIYSSCNKATTRQTKPCADDVMCTEVFMSVTAHVVDKQGNNVELDAYDIVRSSTGERIQSQQNDRGYYTIVDDSYRKKLQNTSDKFRFTGKKNGKEVVNEEYTISADCCHIKMESGLTEIIVE